MKMLKITVMLLMSLLITAMTVNAQEIPLANLDGTRWVLQEMVQDGAPIELVPDTEITLEFVEGQIAGSAGCNSYFTSYDAEAVGLEDASMGSTMKLCLGGGGEFEIMEQETLYLAALSTVTYFTRDGDTLIATYGANSQLVFVSAQETRLADLDGTNWVLQEIIRDGEVIELVTDTEITLEFADGQVAGSAGCNSYFATYEADSISLVDAVIGSTMMACQEDIMQQEVVYLGALGAVTNFTRAENTLTATYGDGNQLVFGLQQPDDSVTNTNTNFVTGMVVVRDTTDLTQLPEDAVVVITLADVSLMDAPSVTLSEARLSGFPVLPIPFALGYDPAEIEERNSYAVRAQVVDAEGNLLYTSDTMHPVLTRDADNTTTVELIAVGQ